MECILRPRRCSATCRARPSGKCAFRRARRARAARRSVCDAIRYRNKVGADVCAEVVRNYLNRSERNVSKLIEYANKLRIKKTLNNYLEVLL